MADIGSRALTNIRVDYKMHLKCNDVGHVRGAKMTMHSMSVRCIAEWKIGRWFACANKPISVSLQFPKSFDIISLHFGFDGPNYNAQAHWGQWMCFVCSPFINCRTNEMGCVGPFFEWHLDFTCSAVDVASTHPVSAHNYYDFDGENVPRKRRDRIINGVTTCSSIAPIGGASNKQKRIDLLLVSQPISQNSASHAMHDFR